MKCFPLAISIAIAMLTVSCHEKEDAPSLSKQYHIRWITTDNSAQIFEYDNSELLSQWELQEDQSVLYKSSYTYPSDGDKRIAIVAEERRSDDDVWLFNENLFLNPDGTAIRAVGTAVLKSGAGQMMKNYTVDFHYNNSQLLTKVDITERRTDGAGWEEPNALEWSADLEWNDGNLTKYTEYSNPDHPMTAISYTYFGGSSVDYLPIVQRPILRSYYLPLQYSGVFGKMSTDMVKTCETTSNGLQRTSTFSYDISTSIENSMIEAYTHNQDNKELKYEVIWEPFFSE